MKQWEAYLEGAWLAVRWCYHKHSSLLSNLATHSGNTTAGQAPQPQPTMPTQGSTFQKCLRKLPSQSLEGQLSVLNLLGDRVIYHESNSYHLEGLNKGLCVEFMRLRRRRV